MVGLMQITKFSDGFYLEIFNEKYKKYGGHWQRLGSIVNFIVFNLSARKIWFEDFGFGVFNNSMFGYSCMYYDGYNHSLWFWKFHFGWGGSPLAGEVDLMIDKERKNGNK